MILILGGTKDAREIKDELSKYFNEIYVSVTTEFGAELLSFENTIIGEMSSLEMENFIKQKNIKFLIDATHPFAEIASKNAMQASENCNIKYIRFERKNAKIGYENAVFANSHSEAVDYLKNIDGNIFLTIGSKALPLYVNNLDIKKIFARVLPSYKIVKICEDLGLLSNQIIAINGAFSRQLNFEMIKFTNAKIIVTKESGEVGGEIEKIEAAKMAGIKALIVKRPQIAYKNLCDKIEKVLEVLKIG